jgi:superfamily I DNA/RNA helicase
MTDSPYQVAIYQALKTTTNNITVKATAGSGKTTTIVNACAHLPYGKRSLFVAFNRHTVQELKDRLPNTVDCFTLHSVGAKSIYASKHEVTMNEKKQLSYLEPEFYHVQDVRERWAFVYEADRLLSLVRATMTKLTVEDVMLLAKNHNLFPDEEVVYAVIAAAFEMKQYWAEERSTVSIDFQDMIEAPALRKEIRVPQYDFVLVDEAQDCSKLDQLLIERLLKPVKGRLIAVGDDRQSVYSFRGADVGSFDHFRTRPNTVNLPLTVSYRCPKSVVKEAQKLYQEIEPFDGNFEGEVREGELAEVVNGDMVIARNLRPLIVAFMDLLDQGKKPVIIGKELTKNLLQLLEGVHAGTDIGELVKHNSLMLSNLTERLKQRGVQNYTAHPKYETLREKLQVLELLGRKCATIGQLKSMINHIFDDESVRPIRLMTVHKSKGLEADRVFFIRSFEGNTLIPSGYAVTADQLTQEKNLQFVATTRAKKSLVYVDL